MRVGDKHSSLNRHGPGRGLKGHGWGERRVPQFEKAWLRRETSARARRNMVWVGDERSSLNRHGPGGRQALELKRTWRRWHTSSCARIDTVGWRRGQARKDPVEGGYDIGRTVAVGSRSSLPFSARALVRHAPSLGMTNFLMALGLGTINTFPRSLHPTLTETIQVSANHDSLPSQTHIFFIILSEIFEHLNLAIPIGLQNATP